MRYASKADAFAGIHVSFKAADMLPNKLRKNSCGPMHHTLTGDRAEKALSVPIKRITDKILSVVIFADFGALKLCTDAPNDRIPVLGISIRIIREYIRCTTGHAAPVIK